MPVSKSTLLKGSLIAAAAAASLVTVGARAATKSYIVCNQWNECWRVKEKLTTYPADVHVIYRDNSWWAAHEHDAQWRELPDPSDDHGWYDKDGNWHPFAPPEP